MQPPRFKCTQRKENKARTQLNRNTITARDTLEMDDFEQQKKTAAAENNI